MPGLSDSSRPSCSFLVSVFDSDLHSLLWFRVRRRRKVNSSASFRKANGCKCTPLPDSSFLVLPMARSVAYATFLLFEIIYSETFSYLYSLKMIESRNAVGQYDTTLQLKAQVSYYYLINKNVYMFHAVITYVCVAVSYRVLLLDVTVLGTQVPFM